MKINNKNMGHYKQDFHSIQRDCLLDCSLDGSLDYNTGAPSRAHKPSRACKINEIILSDN